MNSKMEEGPVDKRIFARVALNFPVKILNLETSQYIFAETYDICAKGIGLISQQRILPQTSLDIWVEIPGQSEPFYVRAQTVWEDKPFSDKYRMGVNFRQPELMGVARALWAAGKIP